MGILNMNGCLVIKKKTKNKNKNISTRFTAKLRQIRVFSLPKSLLNNFSHKSSLSFTCSNCAALTASSIHLLRFPLRSKVN